VAFEVHVYLDDGSGSSPTCQSPTIGAERMQAVTDWLRTHGKKGFLGEFGAASNATCLAGLTTLLNHLEANSTLYLGWTYWAAGPWWGDYFTSLDPSGGADKPQMATLAPHLGVQTPPPPPSGCQPTYEAETMFHSTGGATAGGWNIYTNGYIATPHTFATSGMVTLTVTAAGTVAAGVWPHMVVSVGGVVIGSIYVTSSTWALYTFTFSVTAGTKEVRISFDNDYCCKRGDRNLLVDKVVVGCPG